MPPFLVQLLISITLSVVAYAIMPKPKVDKPPAAKDQSDPTAEAGRPIPVVFGSMRVSSPNFLWYGDKAMVMRKLKSGGKKK